MGRNLGRAVLSFSVSALFLTYKQFWDILSDILPAPTHMCVFVLFSFGVLVWSVFVPLPPPSLTVPAQLPIILDQHTCHHHVITTLLQESCHCNQPDRCLTHRLLDILIHAFMHFHQDVGQLFQHSAHLLSAPFNTMGSTSADKKLLWNTTTLVNTNPGIALV